MNLAAIFPNLLAWPRRLEGDVMDLAVRWHPVLGAAGTVVVAAALVLLLLWSYRRAGSELTPQRRGTLLVIRLAALVCLLPALLELSLQLRLRHQVKPALALAIDTSKSMSLSDQYNTEEQRQALATAIGARPESESMSRMELVRRMISANGGSRLERLEEAADLAGFTFDEAARATDLKALSIVTEDLDPSGGHTFLADSIGGIVEQLRGRPTAGILLLSDGADNSVVSPQASYAHWQQAGVAVHTLAIGDPEPKDVEVLQVLADDLLFAGDPATVIVRLRQRGYPGRQVRVLLRLHREELASADATFPDGQPESEISVPVTFTPKQAGEHAFRVVCPEQPGETATLNNLASFVARVSSEPIRVLYIEHRPRWQYRFLADAMNRDRRIKLHILLTGAEPVAKPLPPFINALPDTRDAFQNQAYDLIILGDVDPAVLTTGRMNLIRDLVRDGEAGILLLAGPCFNPRAYADTPLAELFPIEPAVAGGEASPRPRADQEDAFRPVLSPAGRSHPALQLADGLDESIERWESTPEIFWFAPVRKARPGASVLLTHPTETTEEMTPQPMPLMAIQHFGRGRAFYCGIDETWRWRRKQGDRVFYRLWGQVVQYLASEQQSALRTDRPRYGRGEMALVTARIDDLGGDPPPPLLIESEGGEQREFTLTPVPGAEHRYEARVPLPALGLYKIWIKGRALEASASIEVEAPELELRSPAANVDLMKEIAANTGGQYARPGEFDDWVNRLDLSPRTIDEQMDVPLWDRPLIVILFVGLLAADWVLRRLWQLP